MKLLRVPIADVLPWDKNPRGIKAKDFDRLKKHGRVEDLAALL